MTVGLGSASWSPPLECPGGSALSLVVIPDRAAAGGTEPEPTRRTALAAACARRPVGSGSAAPGRRARPE